MASWWDWEHAGAGDVTEYRDGRIDRPAREFGADRRRLLYGARTRRDDACSIIVTIVSVLQGNQVVAAPS